MQQTEDCSSGKIKLNTESENRMKEAMRNKGIESITNNSTFSYKKLN